MVHRPVIHGPHRGRVGWDRSTLTTWTARTGPPRNHPRGGSPIRSASTRPDGSPRGRRRRSCGTDGPKPRTHHRTGRSTFPSSRPGRRPPRVPGGPRRTTSVRPAMIRPLPSPAAGPTSPAIRARSARARCRPCSNPRVGRQGHRSTECAATDPEADPPHPLDHLRLRLRLDGVAGRPVVHRHHDCPDGRGCRASHGGPHGVLDRPRGRHPVRRRPGRHLRGDRCLARSAGSGGGTRRRVGSATSAPGSSWRSACSPWPASDWPWSSWAPPSAWCRSRSADPVRYPANPSSDPLRGPGDIGGDHVRDTPASGSTVRVVLRARGGSRTRTPFRIVDFESTASAVPPPGPVVTCRSRRYPHRTVPVHRRPATRP